MYNYTILYTKPLIRKGNSLKSNLTVINYKNIINMNTVNNNIHKNKKLIAAKNRINTVNKYNCIKPATKEQILKYSLAADNYRKNKKKFKTHTEFYDQELKMIRTKSGKEKQIIINNYREYPTYVIPKLTHDKLVDGYVERKFAKSVKRIKEAHPDYPISPMFIETHKKNLKDLIISWKKIKHKRFEKKKPSVGNYVITIYTPPTITEEERNKIREYSEKEINLLYEQMKYPIDLKKSYDFPVPDSFIDNKKLSHKNYKISKKIGLERKRLHNMIEKLQHPVVRIHKIIKGCYSNEVREIFNEIRDSNKHAILDINWISNDRNELISRLISSDKELQEIGVAPNELHTDFSVFTSPGIAA